MSQGAIHETGNDLDIALSGDGFLSVLTDLGIVYTRAGNLTLNSAKQLVTQDGRPVLGKNAPISIKNRAALRIGEDGQIFDGNVVVGSIDIVQFPQDVSLKKA